MDQAHVIRHKVLVEKRPIRAVAREMGVARNTVRKYRTTPVPRRAESGPRPQPVREAVERRIHALLSDKRLTSEKQRWTAPTLREALQTEGLEASERTVRRCMAEWKTDVGSGVA